MVIKGAFITLFPNSSMPLYKKVANSSLVVAAGAIAIIVGIVLFYLGLTS
jgi:predicted signal transduction protein with EAL and GGDEF domain